MFGRRTGCLAKDKVKLQRSNSQSRIAGLLATSIAVPYIPVPVFYHLSSSLLIFSCPAAVCPVSWSWCIGSVVELLQWSVLILLVEDCGGLRLVVVQS